MKRDKPLKGQGAGVGPVGGGTLLRSGLTSTKPQSLRLTAPWGAEKICTGDKHGPLSNPGRKWKVPWARQRVEVQTQWGIRTVSCPPLGMGPFGLTEMWSSGVYCAAALGDQRTFPYRGCTVSGPLWMGCGFLFGLWSKCAHWKETAVHLMGCPQPGSKPGAQVSGAPLGGTETNRGTPSIIRWVVSEGGAAKAWVHS